MTIEEVAEAQNWRNSPTGTWGRNLRWTTGGMVTLKQQDGRRANWRQTELLSRRRKRRRRPAEVISQQADQMASPPSVMSASVMKWTSLAAQPNPCVFFVIERFRKLPLGYIFHSQNHFVQQKFSSFYFPHYSSNVKQFWAFSPQNLSRLLGMETQLLWASSTWVAGARRSYCTSSMTKVARSPNVRKRASENPIPGADRTIIVKSRGNSGLCKACL